MFIICYNVVLEYTVYLQHLGGITMDPQQLAQAIAQMLEHDPEYHEIMEQVSRYEPAYLRILQNLSPEDRDALELYIGACEDAQYHRIYPAYRLGQAKR